MSIFEWLDMDELISIRHHMHQHPELSGQESRTSQYLSDIVEKLNPDILLHYPTGKGFVACFKGKKNSRSVGFRADIDALPIEDEIEKDYKSRLNGVGHKCGHDGHSAYLIGMAHYFASHRDRGDRWLIFQPEEETGSGAEKIVQWNPFGDDVPDYIFGFHNMPGYPLHHIILKNETFCLGSKGLIYHFQGTSSHAAEPEKGNNPAYAMAEVLTEIEDISFDITEERTSIITPIYHKTGSRAFGTNPGRGTLMFTIRASDDSQLSRLEKKVDNIIENVCGERKLKWRKETSDFFPTTINTSKAFEKVEETAIEHNFSITQLHEPVRWSEDFAWYRKLSEVCYFGVGAGEFAPALHHPQYDFPDPLLKTAVDFGVKLSEKIDAESR